MAKKLTSKKARQILHDKSVHGHPLTDKQRRFFGAIAGGAPIKADLGAELINYDEEGGFCYDDKGNRIPCPDDKLPTINVYDKNDPNLVEYNQRRDAEGRYINLVNELRNTGQGLSEEEFNKLSNSLYNKYFPGEDYKNLYDKYVNVSEDVESVLNDPRSIITNVGDQLMSINDAREVPYDKRYQYTDISNMYPVYANNNILGFTNSKREFYPAKGKYATGMPKANIDLLANQEQLGKFLEGQGIYQPIIKQQSGGITPIKAQDGEEITYTHQPAGKEYDGKLGESYMVKRTVTPYKSKRDIKRYTQAPTDPRQVNFLSNYAGAIGEPLMEGYGPYPTEVPIEGAKHWNIDRFIIDPQFSNKLGNLRADEYTLEQNRNNVLSDMYKYYMLQDPEHKGKAFRKAKRFVRKEVDPRIKGEFLKAYNEEDLGSITGFTDQNHLKDLYWNEAIGEGTVTPEDVEKLKKASMDYFINYKKMSKKEANDQWKKWEEEAGSFIGNHNYEMSNLINKEQTNLPENRAGWNVEYFNPDSKKTETKHFTSNKEAEEFYNTTPGEKTKYSDASSYKRKNGGWLDSYQDGGGVESRQAGYTDIPFNYNSAWGGQFANGGSTGGTFPGSTGFMYARTGSIPSNGPYAKKTKPSAENGMTFYQHGLDWKPKTISRNGGWLDKYDDGGKANQVASNRFELYKKGGIIKDDMGQWAHPGEVTEIGSNRITMQGVPYPVLGISDQGDVQMMQPEGEYKFKGKKVTEIPMAQNGVRTSDSLRLYNNTMALLDYYGNKKKYKDLGRSAADVSNITSANMAARKDMIDRLARGQYPTTSRTASIVNPEDEDFTLKDYYGAYKSDPYKYFIRELANNIIDLNAPVQEYDTRIKPTVKYGYENISKGSGWRANPLYGDIVSFYGYDPILIKPYNMLTPAEKAERTRLTSKPTPVQKTPTTPQKTSKTQTPPPPQPKPKPKPVEKPYQKKEMRENIDVKKRNVMQNMNVGLTLRPIEVPELEVPGTSGPYKVDYFDPTESGGVQGGWHTASFKTQDEADRYMDMRKSAGKMYGSGMTRRVERKNGGTVTKKVSGKSKGSWLDQYK